MLKLPLVELNDQPWMPALFRDFITDHLRYLEKQAGMLAPVCPLIARSMRAIGQTQIVDLCSGAGGPLPDLIENLRRNFNFTPTVTLTDRYPNRKAFREIEERFGDRVNCLYEPTNAVDLPAELTGFRTLFSSLHHFRPGEAKAIFADAKARGAGIAAFEAQDRRISSILRVVLYIVFSSIFFTPVVGRLTAARVIFTYLLPLAPLIFMWDGFVSCLRTYSVEELIELTEDLTSGDYTWEVGQTPARSAFVYYRITYVIGMPSPSSAAAATNSASGDDLKN